MTTLHDMELDEIECLASAVIDDTDNFDVAVHQLMQEGWSERDAREKVAAHYLPSDIEQRQELFRDNRLPGSLF